MSFTTYEDNLSYSQNNVSYPFGSPFIRTRTVMSPFSPSVYSPVAPLIRVGSPVSSIQITTDSMSPFVPSMKINTASVPLYNALYPTIPEFDISRTHEVQSKVATYYKYLTLDKWLYEDLGSLLKFLKVKDGQVSLVKSTEEFKSNDTSKDTLNDIEAKSDWMEKNVLTDRRMHKILSDLVISTGTKWINLPRKEFEKFVKEVIQKELTRKLQEAIEKK